MSTSKKKTKPASPAFKYKPRFAAIVECKDEAEQKRVHAVLAGLGLKVKLVRV